MPATREELSIVVYAPVLRGDDPRPVNIARAMEGVLVGRRLEWTFSDQGQPIALPQRDAWLAENSAEGGFPFICNNDEHTPVMLSGREHPAMPGPGGQAILEVRASMPLDANSIAVAASLLESIAESARAFWGHASPKGLGSEVARQMRHSADGPRRSPRGLPMLELPWHVPPPTPYHLGWLNHWSPAAAQAIGFPNPALEDRFFSQARRASSGGWLVKLTETPLDLDDPAHLEALLRAYERFPGIGGRAPSRVRSGCHL